MTTWQEDADLFGQLQNNDKWVKASLAARSVTEGDGQGSRSDLGENSPKSSLRAFASRANVDHKTVGRYLKVWDLAAEYGYVPHRDELEPGTEVILPDKDTWKKVYQELFPRPSKQEKEQPEPEILKNLSEDDIEDLTESKRALKLFKMAEDSVANVPGIQGDQLRRLVESLEDVAWEDDPKKAFLRALHSVAELAATFKEIR